MDHLEQFEQFRQLYPGRKRGFETELKDFKKHNKDWREVIHLLAPAVRAQMAEREAKKLAKTWCPQWKDMVRWLKYRCWEETVETDIPDEFEAAGLSRPMTEAEGRALLGLPTIDERKGE